MPLPTRNVPAPRIFWSPTSTTTNRSAIEFLDPDRQPELARRYEIRSYGTLVLEGYQKKQPIQRADEESFSNALLKLTRRQEKKIYFLIGHGEHDLKDTSKNGYSNLDAALEKENYQIDELNLLQSGPGAR